MTFQVPDSMSVDVVEPLHYPPLADLRKSVRESLAAPLGSQPITEMVKPSDKVCIAVTDITRNCPDELLVGPILKMLQDSGVPEGNITILVAVGMHRPSTRREKSEKLGKEIAGRYRVLDHDARDVGGLVDLGPTASGVPMVFSRMAFEADLLLSTGIVEPHQLAGFSGGGKTAAVGLAGEKTISWTHSPAMLDHQGTQLARTEGNPFHRAVREIYEEMGLRFCINVVRNGEEAVCAVLAGEPGAVFEKLSAVARQVYTVPVSRPYDSVICGIGYPKDSNLYQASRGPSYIFCAPGPVIVPGGILIVPAPCQEGAGRGPGEERFFETMKKAPDVRTILAEARTAGYRAGEQRAFILARVMEENEVVVVGSRCPEIVREAKMIPAETMAEALKYVEERLGREAGVLVVPRALQTLPVLGAGDGI
jgi:nickel-dependent lactate racemase